MRRWMRLGGDKPLSMPKGGTAEYGICAPRKMVLLPGMLYAGSDGGTAEGEGCRFDDYFDRDDQPHDGVVDGW